MNIYTIGALVAIGFWGITGIGHGAKFLWKHSGCIVLHGVKACKAQTVGNSLKR